MEWLVLLCVFVALNVSVVGLERALLQYCSQPQPEAFDLKTVPIDTSQFNKNRIECKLRPHMGLYRGIKKCVCV